MSLQAPNGQNNPHNTTQLLLPLRLRFELH